jgi:hypothetical protein
MRKLAVLLLALFIAVSFATTATEQNFQQRTTGFAFEVARNWQILSIFAIMISIILVAIAYAVGVGFEMPEIQAWASNEMVQIVTNAIIIACLMGVLAFIELTVLGIVTSSGLSATMVPGCYGQGNSTSCLQSVTSAYLNDYYSAALTSAKDVLNQNVDAAAWAGRRIGLYCLTIYCLQIGATTTMAGHYILKSDMYGILFEYYTTLIGFMGAQQFVVEQICFKMGPVILALGILGRSFFFTRKLGGLLMAIAIGLMFFLPGMYVFDWITLDTTINGDKGTDQPASACPAVCALTAPYAYTDNGSILYGQQDVFAAFSAADSQKAVDILNGTAQDYQATTTNTSSSAYNRDVISCNYQQVDHCPVRCRQDGAPDFCATIPDCLLPPPSICPMGCRELPYPTAPACLNMTTQVQQACAKLPAQCKIIRQIPSSEIDQHEYAACPDSCKVVPPLQSNCDVGQCLDSSLDCRYTYRNASDPTLSYRPSKNYGDSDQQKAHAAQCALASQCPASLTASQSCVYVLPQTGSCNDLCGSCPIQCRIDAFATMDPSQIPQSCKDSNGNYLQACVQCTDGCKAQYAEIQANQTIAQADNKCGSCPLDHWLISSGLPQDYLTGGCDPAQCPSDYRVAVPRNACEMCLYSQESYAYSPPIDTQCSDECKPSDQAPTPDQSTYSKVGQDGLVGIAEIQDLSRLMVPVYVLPLFNIVATLVFIKGLSAFLGGDIDIPGISRVF